MRIHCPYCGERDISEFSYLGDAAFRRPDPLAPGALERFVEAVYQRDNPAGRHLELWYHTHGCLYWLQVERDTLTHRILGVAFAGAATPEGPVS